MGLKKGQTNNPDGRPVGSKNEKTEQWEKLSDSILNKHAKRFNNVLENANDAEFAKMYISVLAFFKPRMGAQNIDVSNEDESLKPIHFTTEEIREINAKLESEC